MRSGDKINTLLCAIIDSLKIASVMRQHNRLPHESANARALHRRINKSFQLDGANIRKPNDNTNAEIGNTCNQLL